MFGNKGGKQSEAATGRFARFPNRPMQCSMPQKEMSKRGLMMTMSAMIAYWRELTGAASARLEPPRFDAFL
jgi:hypothetical protein